MAIEKAVNALAPSFTFGAYDVDDIKQQGRLYALELLEKEVYDVNRPLENLLYTHVKFRLINLRRDKLRRSDSPCKACHSGLCCTPDGTPCEKYVVWRDRNQAKANIARPLDIDNVSDEHEHRTRTESTVVEDAAVSELVERIDKQLPVEMRGDYLRMKANVHIPKGRRYQVEEAIKKIVGEF